MSATDSTITVEYRAIPDFPAYRVGSDGSVWSRWKLVSRGFGCGTEATLGNEWKRLKPCVDKDGYHAVRLRAEKRYHHRRIHRLVLEVFVGPCPASMVAAHNNGIPSDNRLDNLRWDTQARNIADKAVHNTAQIGERHGMSRLKERDVREIRQRRAAGEPARGLARSYGVSLATVNFIITRRLWKHIV